MQKRKKHASSKFAPRQRQNDGGKSQPKPKSNAKTQSGSQSRSHAGPHSGSKPKRNAAQSSAGPASRPPTRTHKKSGDTKQWIYGTHAAHAVLANPRRRVQQVLATSEAQKILGSNPSATVTLCSNSEISQILPAGAVHQGIGVLADHLPEPHLDDIRPAEGMAGQKVIVLDQVTDPQNVGAILRSAAAFGAKAVIQQTRNAAPATGTLAKAASGALEWVPLISVTNLARALRELADWGYFRLGLSDEASQSLSTADSSGHVALVLGAEGKGLRQLTRQNCDILVSLPTTGAPASLNVSNAAAVALYELTRSN